MIRYTWTEEETVGYRQADKAVQDSVTTFTNEAILLPIIPEFMKQPSLPGGIFAWFTTYRTALGTETIINHVGDCFD